MKTKPSTSTDLWIKNRQELSWEPEILISGIVLFALFRLPDQLDKAQEFINGWSFILFTGNIDEMVIAFLKTSTYFLIIGLIVNLIFRSIWVGMIGLSYVFPSGIDRHRLNFTPYFDRKIKRLPSYKDSVKQLDKVCSTIYSVTFLMFMATLGVTCYLLSLTLLALMPLYWNLVSIQNFSKYVDVVFGFTSFALGGLYFIDFITLGWLKKFRWFSVIYKPIYLIMSFLTLASIYRPIYYGLISNYNRWKIGFAGILYVALFYLIVNAQLGENVIFKGDNLYKRSVGVASFDGYYRDKQPKKHSLWLSIQSTRIGSEPLEVFIPYKTALEDSIIVQFIKVSGLSMNEIVASDSLAMESLRNYYQLAIDGAEPQSYPLFYLELTALDNKGMVTFIPTDTLSKGQHYVELWTNDSPPKIRARVPFFKY